MSVCCTDAPRISVPLEKGLFSLREANGLVKSLHRPIAWIYWVDFLTSITAGHVLFHALLNSGSWLGGSPLFVWSVRVCMYVAMVLLFLRSVMFTHELVHLPRKGYRAFRIVWNLLCGIPFMIPSFMYYPHVDHHRRQSYGTEDDGEYLNLSHQPPRAIVLYMLLTLITPLAGFFRFAVLAPICWFLPKVRQWTFHRASTMVMDVMYYRPEAGKAVHRIMFMQELACFGVCMFIVFRTPLRGEYFDPLWVQAYLVSVGLLIMNNIRTLGSHRWTGDGEVLSFQEQLLDSCDYPYRPWITELWGPVGTRYHATHHLFPSIPYHNLGAAHRALMAGLPADSPYRETVKHGLLHEIFVLWGRAAKSASARRARGSSCEKPMLA